VRDCETGMQPTCAQMERTEARETIDLVQLCGDKLRYLDLNLVWGPAATACMHTNQVGWAD